MLIHIEEYGDFYSNSNQFLSGVKDLEIFYTIYGSQCHLLLGITQFYNYIYRFFFLPTKVNNGCFKITKHSHLYLVKNFQ